MLVAERLDKIVALVNEKGSIRVTELSKLCEVTEETIRRDLDRLEREGKLQRSHGGAVSIKEQNRETPYFIREVMNTEEKRQIAEAAIRLIEPGERILLDASTTAWYMASILPDIPLTVLTNSIRVATELSMKEKIEVVSTGGTLASRSMSFVGPLAESSLEVYHVDKLFLSAKGVHLTRGISESTELQARIKQKMIQAAERVILLADSSKFGIQAFTRVALLEEVDEVVTDRNISAEILEQLQALECKVTLV
ncbi:DeoR/GlpR family DNA-binding transcription regulator [Paenibacillus senegalensis]|uniref:DeoR/GlpR family DNA-binding transcription regulator n=1 Tax=Paenibacillus senegalensis TaxID=1465766 RepID=UPI000289CD7B|nr:DeoR/GlpR family DNA-binding transcription regulator [Paenibacillus senegalensis]